MCEHDLTPAELSNLAPGAEPANGASDDVLTAARERITERRALLAAGDAAPWENRRGNLMVPLHEGSRIDLRLASVFPTGNGPKPNADLIVAAVNAFAAATDHAERVLNRHLCHRPDGAVADYCTHCPDALYPCPDARAALVALNVPGVE